MVIYNIDKREEGLERFMRESKYYRVYSEYLRDKYGEKVYKLPIKLDLTCPNRDGSAGLGGCIFCGEEGGSFENHSKQMGVREQLERNKEKISKKYKAGKFIAFFQNFTNTYMPFDVFKMAIEEAVGTDIVGISISTRPDCVGDEHLEFLKLISYKHGVDITIELGIQSVNYHTLDKINRGHGLAEFIDAMNRINRYGFDSCVHFILNLPWDHMRDIEEGAKIVSALGVKEIKFHSLYIVDGTELGEMYKREEIEMESMEDYVDRAITFLEYLDPEIAVQRLIGRAPSENSLFVNWDMSWWKVRDAILDEMESRGSYQGKRYDYLGGSGLKKFRGEIR